MTDSKIPQTAAFTLEEMLLDQEFSFEVEITDHLIDRFAELTGDYSPLHMDRSFARGRGFENRLAHGALITGFVSRLIGMHLPGRNCLFQTLKMQFSKPVYPGTQVRVTGTVDQISEASAAIVVKIRVVRVADGDAVAKGSVSLGFTQEGSHA